jgi:peptide/nickel transport system substrate-binding protein
VQGGSGSFGNVATRLETFVVKGGAYVYGSYPDLDAMFDQQAVELDHAKRADMLTKMQQIVYERVIVTHLWQLAFINGAGPRVGESNIGKIAGFPYTAPYEDLTLKSS